MRALEKRERFLFVIGIVFFASIGFGGIRVKMIFVGVLSVGV